MRADRATCNRIEELLLHHLRSKGRPTKNTDLSEVADMTDAILKLIPEPEHTEMLDLVARQTAALESIAATQSEIFNWMPKHL